MTEKTLLAKLFSLLLLHIFVYADDASAQNRDFLKLASGSMAAEVESPRKSNEVFIITDIPLYAGSNNLFNAETEAVDRGIIESFQSLVHRVSLAHQDWKIKDIKLASIMSAIKDIKIRDERKTAFTYSATGDFTFDEHIVKSILSRAGFQYYTSYSPVFIVIPVVEKDGEFLIWEDDEWMSAWGNMPNIVGLLKLNYLLGDLSDEVLLDPKLVATAKLPYFKKIMQKYNAQEILIVVGTYSGSKFKVMLRHLSDNNDKSKLIEHKFRSEINLEEFYENIAKDTLQIMDTYYKKYDSFDE